MTSLTRSPNHVTPVPRPKLHLRELRFQESEARFLVNLLSLITEKFLSIFSQNFNFYFCMMVQLLCLLLL